MRAFAYGSLAAMIMGLAACGGSSSSSNSGGNGGGDNGPSAEAVVVQQAELTKAMFEDSLVEAQDLQTAIEAFIASPSEQSLEAAKAAYKALRIPYQQSEIMRFDDAKGHVSAGLDADGGPASIDDWEPQVNGWPLDEALIDYVDMTAYEGEYDAAENIINSSDTDGLGANITKEMLIGLNSYGGSAANIATGIHAVEFLLWGQDTNGVNAGAGNRPISDYYTEASMGDCTSGDATHDDASICFRRAEYLSVATDLLVDDLEEMVAEWSDEARTTAGTLAYDFLNRTDGLQRMVDSMGDMAAGELASERMKVAILTGSTEDEHDCFSDNTHVAVYNNAIGVINSYRGSYTRIDGSVVSGPSLSDMVAAADSNANNEIEALLDTIEQQMQVILDLGEDTIDPMRFDQLVGGSANDKQVVLDAANSLLDFAGYLSDEVVSSLSLSELEVDLGTCPDSNPDNCDI